MDDPEISSSSTISAMRFAHVLMSMNYPIVSAYEFDFLQQEKIIRERWDESTIYLIVQRPLTYFDNVVIDDKYIRFEIADGNNPPLPCRINPITAGLCQHGESIDIQIGFYSNKANTQQPIRNAGGIKLYRENGDFILWWSPQKLLYEMLVKGFEVEIAEGFDPHCFLDFKVHYIGKSFSQKVWNRLTGHNKMQRILTREQEVGQAPEARAPFEISLVILQINDVVDLPMICCDAEHPLADANSIVLTMDGNDESTERLMTQPNIHVGDEALTREAEAYLINLFKPAYNEVLFDNYPNIAGGMRSKGYSETTFDLDSVPAFLYTDYFSMVPEVAPNCDPT